MWNAGTAPARMIEVISPAGFENYFRSLVEMTASGEPDMESIAGLASEYGNTIANQDWLPDVIERYGLTQPG